MFHLTLPLAVDELETDMQRKECMQLMVESWCHELDTVTRSTPNLYSVLKRYKGRTLTSNQRNQLVSAVSRATESLASILQ
jgi:hypothetical protein